MSLQAILGVLEARASRAALLRVKGQCAQLYGTLDKFQAIEVDSIQSVRRGGWWCDCAVCMVVWRSLTISDAHGGRRAG